MRKFIFLFSVLLCSTFMFAKDYKDYGRLQVIHNQLCDENGTPIQLRGIVLPNLNALPYMCDGKTDVTNMKDLGANVVNITMDIANLNINKITNILDWCYEKDMYAIVNLSFGSYHGDCFSTYKLSCAKDYFTKMAEYCVPKNYKNVMYNICSDVEGNTWDEIKSYASTIIPIIEKKHPGSVVMVCPPDTINNELDGYPWTNLQAVVDDPINVKDYPNVHIMYNVYYYTNKYIYNEEPYTLDNEAVDYLNTISQASRKLPLFVSDWHFGDVNGSTFIRKYAADELITTCYQNKGFQLISWCAGNWDDNNRCASIWKSYYYENLTDTGKYIKAALQADEPAIPENTFDVNKDKRVNAADVVSVYNYIIIGSQSGITREKANVNGDNDVNAADVVSIYNYIVGS